MSNLFKIKINKSDDEGDSLKGGEDSYEIPLWKDVEFGRNTNSNQDTLNSAILASSSSSSGYGSRHEENKRNISFKASENIKSEALERFSNINNSNELFYNFKIYHFIKKFPLGYSYRMGEC